MWLSIVVTLQHMTHQVDAICSVLYAIDGFRTPMSKPSRTMAVCACKGWMHLEMHPAEHRHRHSPAHSCKIQSLKLALQPAQVLHAKGR